MHTKHIQNFQLFFNFSCIFVARARNACVKLSDMDLSLPFVGRCSVTRLVGHQLATTWVKILELYFQMTTEADLLEAAATLVFTVEFSWSTVEMIAQASDDIIKVVPKMKTRSSDLCP